MKKFLILLVVFFVVGFIPALKYTEYDTLFTNKLAEGFGRTLAIGALSCLGLLYKRNKTLGFGIAAVIFTILGVIVGIKQGAM